MQQKYQKFVPPNLPAYRDFKTATGDSISKITNKLI